LPAGLYVVATPIGHLGDISLRALATLAAAETIACEDTRPSGAMLAKYGIKKPLIAYHDHNAAKQRPHILRRVAGGEAVALISDAGMPLIADPGYKLVRACHEAGLAVTVIPGASAAITALAGSGLPTDRFFFAGFLPPKSAARKKAIASLRDIPATLIFYEAPQRLASSLADLAAGLGKTREAVVARELTKLFEESRHGALEELAAFYEEREVKGEITLVVAPPEESADAAVDLDALLKKHMKDMSLRDAVAAVAALTGIKKGAVYARALAMVSDTHDR
jgi:16S rRNA (cytidine1402-2'-O)-methyltransferase